MSDFIGQFPPAQHVIAHLSDPQLGAGETVYNGVRAFDHLERTMQHVISHRPEAIIFTGDIADAGDRSAYVRAAQIVGDAADQIGAEVIWVMGNHDSRVPFAQELLGEDWAADRPIDRAVWLGGLRVIALDSTIPGYHDGRLDPAQLDWLAGQLANPAPEGTILALHHPPTPTHLPLMAVIELADIPALGEVVRGTDVRTIVAGHFHYSTHTTLAGIPVSVAPSTCYGIDAGHDPGGMSGVDGLRGYDLLHVHPDQVVHSTVHLGPVDRPDRQVTGYPNEAVEFVLSVPEHERRDLFAAEGGMADDAWVEP